MCDGVLEWQKKRDHKKKTPKKKKKWETSLNYVIWMWQINVFFCFIVLQRQYCHNARWPCASQIIKVTYDPIFIVFRHAQALIFQSIFFKWCFVHLHSKIKRFGIKVLKKIRATPASASWTPCGQTGSPSVEYHKLI